MRTRLDRVRHAVMFELILLILLTLLGSSIMDVSAVAFGGLSMIMSFMAMVMNYLFNLAFDKALLRLGRPLYPRGLALRVLHTALFEISLNMLCIPIIMFGLSLDFMTALALDAAMITFVAFYTLAFNWIYDLVFKVPANAATL